MLTKDGKLVNEKINNLITDAVNKVSKDLNESERDTFYHMFNLITDNLEGICNSYIEES